MILSTNEIFVVNMLKQRKKMEEYTASAAANAALSVYTVALNKQFLISKEKQKNILTVGIDGKRF